MDNPAFKQRIACYTLISKNAGSLASANFLIVEELLKRGYEIDLYGIGNFNYPEELSDYKNLHYIPLRIAPVQYIWYFLEKLPQKGGKLYTIWAKISSAIYFNFIGKKANENHQDAKYKFTLFLGLPAFFRIKNIPSISWLQGTFQTEWESIKKLKNTIISLCGIKEYLILQAFYTYSNMVNRRIYKFTDIFICGSEWSQENLILWGLDKKNIKILPYPIDLNFFQPKSVERDNKDSKKVFLWLGRIVPRKRLDLLLEAFQELLKENYNVHLIVIGQFSYAKGYKKLIKEFEFPENLHYQENISRLDVPELMNSVDFLIQPSESENFGSSVAEALCCGVPVILGNTNGTKDFISSSSWIFKEYSVKSLKEIMQIAMDTINEKRTEISLEARTTAEKEFDIVTVVDNLENIFAEALTKLNH
ncbi:glycosyltransferase [Anabaena sp. UHCC 0451]|uniref:glycosyltransferase n=1 Tax=Anabaena sp. UHCC 0451 TaxID=2055235 RepID=UPI002B1EA0C4|nr:glycosyltransferase [Anabaena sp. UHCC 0451]MEA5575969.1 glycosyltransferase [Anabaena sp. UHCC 0451]